MIEGAFILIVGIGIGFAAAKIHYESKHTVPAYTEKSVIDETKFLHPNKKYFSYKDFEEEEGGK